MTSQEIEKLQDTLARASVLQKKIDELTEASHAQTFRLVFSNGVCWVTGGDHPRDSEMGICIEVGIANALRSAKKELAELSLCPRKEQS